MKVFPESSTALLTIWMKKCSRYGAAVFCFLIQRWEPPKSQLGIKLKIVIFVPWTEYFFIQMIRRVFEDSEGRNSFRTAASVVKWSFGFFKSGHVIIFLWSKWLRLRLECNAYTWEPQTRTRILPVHTLERNDLSMVHILTGILRQQEESELGGLSTLKIRLKSESDHLWMRSGWSDRILIAIDTLFFRSRKRSRHRSHVNTRWRWGLNPELLRFKIQSILGDVLHSAWFHGVHGCPVQWAWAGFWCHPFCIFGLLYVDF